MAAPIETAIPTPREVHAARLGLRQRLAPFVRPVLALELLSSELMMISLLLAGAERAGSGLVTSAWLRPVQVSLVVAAFVLAVAAWPRRAEMGALWAEAGAGRRWWPILLANVVSFVLLLHALVQLALVPSVPGAAYPPEMVALCALASVAVAVSLVALAAPFGAWRRIFRTFPTEIMLALSVGFVVSALV